MFLSRAEVRAVERRAVEDSGVPGVVPMENAGRGVGVQYAEKLNCVVFMAANKPAKAFWLKP